jgi:membrane fusion protein, multidrug efflux system
MNPAISKILNVLLPIVIIAVAGLAAFAMIAARPAVETRVPEVQPPLVRVMEVGTEDVQLRVFSQGTVTPRTETMLVPEVAGRIIAISPSFASGGFFEAGEVLVRLDPRDHELAVVSARSQVAQAELRLRHEEEEGAVARREWQSLGQGDPPPLVVREPQLAEVRAALDAARATLERAERDLDRPRIRAPFVGRVREKRADIGQVVTPGSPIATIYSVDVAEVRLPLPNADLGHLDLPLGHRGSRAPASGPSVVLSATFAGRPTEWRGRIVRTEGEIDPATRMVHVVAQVQNPYGPGPDSQRPPLAVGMFVEAEILGRQVADVVVLPRSALRGANEVMVVDHEDRLRFRMVEVLQADRERVLITSGLAAGERVCLSTLDAAVDGMRVRIATDGDRS